PLTRRALIALVIGYLGVVVLAQAGQALGPLDFTGLGLAMLSTLLWAGYWIAGVKDPRPPVTALFQNFTLALPLLWLWVRPAWPGTEAALAAAYVGLFEMGLTFALWVSALRLTRHTARISRLIFLSPPLSLLLITSVLGEPLQWQTWAGLGLILWGAWLGRQPGKEA
ncbi:MAG: EamA family transporter, partial [Gammaproteobacteria bacterium]